MLILIAGDYKSGKTVSACSFPKPLCFLNWDGKFESVKNTRGKDGKLIVEDWEQITVIPFNKHEVNPIDFTSSKKAGGKAPPYTKGAIDIMERYNKIVNQLGIDGCVELDGKKIGPFKTVVVDSATSMFSIWEEMIFRMNGISSLGQQEYGTLRSILFKQFIPAMKTIHDKVPYVIVNTHEVTQQDGLTKEIQVAPLGTSFNTGKLMGKEFDEIYRMKIEKDGTRMWKTSKDGKFSAGSDYNLPDITPATFQRLQELIKEGGIVI